MQHLPIVILMLGFLAGGPASPETSLAQHQDRYTADVDSFLARARASTEKYQQLETAIAAGYRKVGPDFPGMGEHWVHVGRAVANELNPRRPAVLSYLRIDREPVLTGVAYAIPLRAGESPPEFPFPEAWHAHTGTIAEETLHLNPDRMHHGKPEGPRLAMIHAWIWTENPAGIFAQDNWALPFLRLNLPVPEKITPQAGKALYLATGGVEYYTGLIQRAGSPTPTQAMVVSEILTEYRDRVTTVVEHIRSDRQTIQEEARKLKEFWFQLWDDLQRELPISVWRRIEQLSG